MYAVIDSSVVMNEFVKARGDVLKALPGAKVLHSEEKLSFGSIPVLHASFRIQMPPPESNQLLSDLYLTASKGKFVKVRATYSATDQPELGRHIQHQFIEDLCKLLER